jgi:CRP/FNR family cyclic AMP-dependent transcriptional regulator
LFIESPLCAIWASTSVTIEGNVTAADQKFDRTSYLAVWFAINSKMTLAMPSDTTPSKTLESAIASFRAAGALETPGDGLLLPRWREEDWRQLFQFASFRAVRAGDALIRRGEPGRTLYFVLHGNLEVIVHSGDGYSMGRIAVVRVGSVLGEQAFFDSGPRSASVYAVGDCEVAAMAPDQFTAFEQGSPALARDLLFALGRILAIRLRKTTAKVAT